VRASGQLKIGEVAKRAGCTVKTVRFYEARGLLPPPARSAAGYRLYGEGQVIVAATSFIRLERRCCPFLRFTLTSEPGEARVVLALTGGPGVRDFLAPWLAA